MSGVALLARGVTWQEIAALSLTTAAVALVVAVPARTVSAAGVESLALALEEAPPAVDGISLVQPIDVTHPTSGRIEDLVDALATADRVGEDVLSDVLPFVGEPLRLAETVTFSVLGVNDHDPAFPTYLTLRYQPDAERAAVSVAGRPATATAEPVLSPDGEESDAPVVDIALTAESAGAALLEVGDLLFVSRAPLQPSSTYVASSVEQIYLRLVEIVDLPSDDDPLWFGDDSLLQPIVFDTSAGADLYVTALLRADQFDAVSRVSATRGLAVEGRYTLSADTPDLARAEALEEAVTRLDNATREVPSVRGDPGVRTGLSVLLDREAERRAAAGKVVETIMVSVLGLAVVQAFTLGSAAAMRRRDRLAVSRGRGADTFQLITSVTMSAVAVAAASAFLTAWLLGRWKPSQGRLGIEAATAAAVVAVGAVAGASGDAIKPLGVLLGRAPEGRVRLRRGLNLSLVVVAVMTVVSGRSGGALGLLAPVVIALVLGRVIERIARWGVGLVSRLRSDAVATIGMWSGTRRREPTPLVVPAVVALTVGGLAWSMLGGIDQAIEAASWQRLAAPVSVEVPPAADRATLAALGATGVASVEVRLQSSEVSGLVELVLIEPAAFARVMDGTPADPELPGAMLASTGGGGPIPIILSSGFGPEPQAEGVILTSLLAPSDLDLQVSQVRADFPGITQGSVFAVASIERFAEAVGFRPRATRYIAATDLPELRQAVELMGGTVTTRAEVAGALASVPLNAGVIEGLRLAAGVIAILGVAGMAAGLFVESSRMARHAATLDALGADHRQRRTVLTAELVPALVAIAVGGLLGWVAGLVAVGGVVDLGPFAGTAAALTPDLTPAVAITAGWALLAPVLAYAVGSMVDRNDAGTVLRADGPA